MIKNLFNIKNKLFLITGSSGGLGFSFAHGLCQMGAKVILNGTNEKKLLSKSKFLKNKGFKVWAYCFDVNDSDGVNKAVRSIEDEIGPIDVLVNNAGITIRNPLESFSDEAWEKIMNVNLNGVFKVSRAVAQFMLKSGRGKIINIGSLQSELGRPSITPYAASKGGLKMLTKGMAVEWGKYNIQCNGIGPGYFKTDMTEPLFNDEEFSSWVCSRNPSGRWGKEEELLGAVVYLSSDASNYVNGQMLYVDGGLLASV